MRYREVKKNETLNCVEVLGKVEDNNVMFGMSFR